MPGDPEVHVVTPPPAIALVRDFVNTVEWQVDTDSWRTPVDLATWMSRHTGAATPPLSEGDLVLARRVREGLRSVLLLHAGHDPLPHAIDDLNEALGLIPLRMGFDARGSASLASAQPLAIGESLGRVISAVDALRVDGSWIRLKACSRDSCRWAYWDTSRNRSGRWCSMAGCGNFVKMARRDGRDTVIVADSGHQRMPTLVDVAGRAGVSIKTVSNVVTGTVRVAEPTRARVQAVIDELGYRPNLAARALRVGRAD